MLLFGQTKPANFYSEKKKYVSREWKQMIVAIDDGGLVATIFHFFFSVEIQWMIVQCSMRIGWHIRMIMAKLDILRVCFMYCWRRCSMSRRQEGEKCSNYFDHEYSHLSANTCCLPSRECPFFQISATYLHRMQFRGLVRHVWIIYVIIWKYDFDEENIFHFKKYRISSLKK